MSVFEDLQLGLADTALDALEASIALRVPPSEPVVLDRALYSRAREMASVAPFAAGYMATQQEADASLFATRANDRLTGLITQTQEAFSTRANGVGELAQLESDLRNFLGAVAPFAAVATRDLAEAAAQVREVKASLTALQEGFENIRADATAALEGAREAAAVLGTTALTEEYIRLASDHSHAARKWLWASAASASALVIGLVLMLGPASAAETTSEVVRTAFGKLSIGLIGAYAVFFCARSYRSHRHLATEYRARAAILSVSQALRVSVEDSSSQAMIMETAVLAAFSVPSSGLVKVSGEDDVSSTAMLAALLSRAGRESPTS